MKNGRPVILVVEDSPLIRMGAIDLVISAGYEALEAGDADEAIRILESRDDIDLVFTDVQMPGTMDGIKLSHYIRDRWPPVKLIVASGAAILEESMLPGGSRFFSKPYDELTITEAMAQLLLSEDPHATIT
ncbi:MULTISPECIES: response regulator [Rhizobium/Agrobacterium group]|uniref:Two component sensor kinase/response regulator hybrid protein n=2 Tax=Rhizobium/Agrobacterium group TaxID=227290 RepID=B9JTD8_ALLAM|nr:MULTISPECIES: response regulator [Rhizobium/Agrobacterium group]ACM35851.1 Two component sensor kinase/response regulator hybrid protein [Allorhizobium ampelinum S4]MCF1448357.1 response regulator [Allorhizobium ampelinum]MCF1491968.1 response regulator [Allorhizobium ampelinum]MUO30366.1 response regulator [Agrobacterium vitis]MUO45278.1 response regulator [Agrobacterium vitis]